MQYNVLLVVLHRIMPRYRYVLIISFNKRDMAFAREHCLIFTLEQKQHWIQQLHANVPGGTVWNNFTIR